MSHFGRKASHYHNQDNKKKAKLQKLNARRHRCTAVGHGHEVRDKQTKINTKQTKKAGTPRSRRYLLFSFFTVYMYTLVSPPEEPARRGTCLSNPAKKKKRSIDITEKKGQGCQQKKKQASPKRKTKTKAGREKGERGAPQTLIMYVCKRTAVCTTATNVTQPLPPPPY